MAGDAAVFAYRTATFGRRTRWLMVCRDGEVSAHEVASVGTDAACCLGCVMLPHSLIFAPVAAWLGEKAIDEKKLHAQTLPVEQRALANLDEALRATIERKRAPASELFLRRTDPSSGFFEIHTSDITEFVSGIMVAGIDTALDFERQVEAIDRLEEWLRRNGALIAED